MPAKRAIVLTQQTAGVPHYRYVLWADVPAGNQAAYRNPAAKSECDNCTPAELQAIRDGLVVERSGVYQRDSGSMATFQTWLQSEWTLFQAEVTAQALWADYGRYWDGAAWQASPGVPIPASYGGDDEGLPTFVALTPVSVFGANKFHLVLHNGLGVAIGQGSPIKVRLVVILPGLAAVTGVAPSVWTLRRRSGLPLRAVRR